MDRNNQRQTKRNTTAAPSCTAAYFLTPSVLPATRSSSICDPIVSGPTADPFLSLTACPAPPIAPQLIPPALVISSDPTIAYCPTAVGYSLTGSQYYSLSGGAQQQSVFFQTIVGINNNQLNYLYDAVPSSSAAIVSYSLSGNTASVQDITKLTESQTVELMGSINSTKFFINTLAVEQARNSLACQTYNDGQFASCTSSAYFGSSAYVPASLKPYSVTAAASTGAFVVNFNLQSSTGNQVAFTLLNIPSLTAAKEQADALASAYAERQLRCVFANDFQDATCHTGAGSSLNNLGYTFPVPNDTLPVLPGLDPRTGSASVTATTVFSNISKAAANSSASTLARAQLSCYFPNEDVSAVCPTAGVASSYPLLGKYSTINWSSTADSVSILNNSLSVSDFNYNTRIVFSSTSATAPAGITYNTIYYSATANSISGGVAIKLNSQTGSHVDYETGSTAYLVNITNSSATVTGIDASVFADYTTGKYAYILRGRLIQNDITASVTASTQLASSIVTSLLDCYWVNAATSATCLPSSFTGVDGTGYTIPASEATSPVYSFTVPYGNIISYISQADADNLASQQAEATLQCYYCNLRVDPMCTPEAPASYPDSVLPLDPAEFIPNCWSINATSGMPPNAICDLFASGAQNTAITISNIPLRDKKIAEEVCCYESEPVSNNIFCNTGAVRGVEGLNSQDVFYLPSGTIVLCSTGGVPLPPTYRFQYDDLWVATDLDYFCCSDTTVCTPAGQSAYVGTLWGNSTLAFETNSGYSLFYPSSGPTALPYNFASTGPHGFNANYLIQKIPDVSTVARGVVQASGSPTPYTRNIQYCPECVTPLIPLNVITSAFTLPPTVSKISNAVTTAMCSKFAGNTGFNIYSSTDTPFSNLFATTWYSNTCGTTPYLPVSAVTGYVAAHISATGYTQYLTFSIPGINSPNGGGTAEYPGKYEFTVAGATSSTNSFTATRSAAQKIFCSDLSASVFTIYCSVPNPFSVSYTGTKSWYSSTCGGPFTPNAGTPYVIGYTSPTGDRYYSTFSNSGSNETSSPTAYSTPGVYPFTVGGVAYPAKSFNAISAAQEIFCSGLSASVLNLYCSVPNPFSVSYTGTKSWYPSTCAAIGFTPNTGTPYVIGYTSPTGDRYYSTFNTSGSNQTGSPTAYSSTCHGIFPYALVPSDVGCSAAGGATAFYSNISDAFTTNGSSTAYFYTKQYSTTAQYTPGSTISFLNWSAPTTAIYHRSTTGPTAPFGSATSDCGGLLYSLAVYFSNTAPSNVCNYPWAVGVSGASGYNSNVTTLYANNPNPFSNGDLTKFYTAFNTATSYVFNNGASGSTTYIAPYNYCTNFNSVYREYQNSGVGSTAYGSSGLYSFTAFVQAPFIAASPSVGNLWETSATNPPDPAVQIDPLDYYKSMRIVNGTTATCQTSTLYTDTTEMFLPARYYSSTAYSKSVTFGRILLNDGVDVQLGTATRVSSTSLVLSNLARIETVFLGAMLQTQSPAETIAYRSYVTNVDKVTGVISLSSEHSMDPGVSYNLKIIGFAFSATGLGSGSTSATGFTTSSPLASKLTVGSYINNSAYITGVSGSTAYFTSILNSTLGITGGGATTIYCYGRYGTQLWTDSNKINSVTGLYENIRISPGGTPAGHVFKDSTEIIFRSNNIIGLDGKTPVTGSSILHISDLNGGNSFNYESYPGGTAPSDYYPVYVPDTVPNINIYCSGGLFYQAGKTRLCDNTFDPTPTNYGPLTGASIDYITPATSTGFAIFQCTTGSGTAYSRVNAWPFNTANYKYVWSTPCDGSNALITTPPGCWMTDTRFTVTSNGAAWGTPVTANSSSNVGRYASMAMVNGNPAISYYDATNLHLKYVRATDTNGTTWAGAAATLDSTGNVGQYTSLAVVNGNPAVCYYDVTNLNLNYKRANDANGTDWISFPVILDSTGNVGQYTSMAIVNGNPAISYYDVTNGNLKYVRATNASGTTWGTPVILDSTGNVGQYTSLAVVNGNPAISYYDATNLNLKYVRATTTSGTLVGDWGTPVILDSTGNVGTFTSLAVVNGNPAISYHDVTNLNLKYVRATTTSGTLVGDWDGPVTVASSGSVGQYTSLVMVNSHPAISYYDVTNGYLKYVRALAENRARFVVSLGTLTSIVFATYVYPCAYPCGVAGYAGATSEPAEDPVASDPVYFGDFSSFSFRDMVTADETPTCNPKQYEANVIAQELVNSFVRCYYLNEAVLYDTCPGPDDVSAATIKLKDGYVAPGTFVSTVSQEDADTIADNIAKSLLTCVTPDQVGGGNTIYEKFEYKTAMSMTLKKISLCSNGEEGNYYYVIANPDGVGPGVNTMELLVAAYNRKKDSEFREFAVKPLDAPLDA